MGPFKCYQRHGGEGAAFPEKNCVMKVYGSKLLALRGVGWGQIPWKKTVT